MGTGRGQGEHLSPHAIWKILRHMLRFCKATYRFTCSWLWVAVAGIEWTYTGAEPAVSYEAGTKLWSIFPNKNRKITHRVLQKALKIKQDCVKYHKTRKFLTKNIQRQAKFLRVGAGGSRKLYSLMLKIPSEIRPKWRPRGRWGTIASSPLPDPPLRWWFDVIKSRYCTKQKKEFWHPSTFVYPTHWRLPKVKAWGLSPPHLIVTLPSL